MRLCWYQYRQTTTQLFNEMPLKPYIIHSIVMICISPQTVFVSHCSGDPFGSCHQMVRNVLLSPDGALCESTDSGALVQWCIGALVQGVVITGNGEGLGPQMILMHYHHHLLRVPFTSHWERLLNSGVVGVISVPVAVVSSSFYNICLTCKPGPTRPPCTVYTM